MNPSPRIWVTFVLLAGFHLLGWALVAGSIALAAWLLLGILYWVTGLVAVVAMVPPIVAIVQGLLLVGVPAVVPQSAVQLDSVQGGGLSAMVAHLSAKAGIEPPEIWLTLDANASVTEDRRLFGLVAWTRRLYVGMPLLAGLSVDQLRAVLAHELGHYVRRHTRFGTAVYRRAAALRAIRDNISQAKERSGLVRYFSGVHTAVLMGYTWLFDLISLSVRRQQEFEADEFAAKVAGPHVLASALQAAYQGLPEHRGGRDGRRARHGVLHGG